MLRLPIALFVPLFAAVALLAQTDTNSQPLGQIVGHVQNATTGDPIPGAQVRLVSIGPVPKGAASGPRVVSSQPDGSFVFDNVPPGPCWLTAMAPNYSPGNYKNNGSPNWMDPLIVQPGAQVAGVILILQPYANVTGIVVDDTGQPVSHAQVKTFALFSMQGKTELQPGIAATTDDAGRFELKSVPAGKVYVAASPGSKAEAVNPQPASPNAPEPKLDLVTTFYPDSLDLSNAVSLDMHSGQDQGNIDIHMKRAATYHIRGKIAVAAQPGKGFAIHSSREDGSISHASDLTTTPGPDSQFDIAGLVPGTYTLRLTASSLAGTGLAPSTEHILSRQDVTVATADVNGIVLSQTPPVTFTCRARSDDDVSDNLARVMVNFVSWEDTLRGVSSAANATVGGSVTADPGLYLIHVLNIPPGSYISSLQVNQADALNKVVDLSQGGAAQVDIVFRKGLAELDGSLASNGDPTPRRATIVLVPESLAPDGSNLITRGAGRNASFSLTNVPPGRYTAFAVEQFNYNAWQNPNFIAGLQGRGISVDLEEKDRKTIELPVISTSDLMQIMSQLSLGE